MRFVVFGAGAIGGLTGALLFEAGHDVTLIARGAHAEAIARRGLLLETPEGERRIDVPVVTLIADANIRSGDFVLLAMKSQDCGTALTTLRRVAPASTPVACMQNGVDNERMALRLFDHVYGVCVMCPATHLEPGVIEVAASPVPGLLDVGRYPEGTDANSGLLAGAYRSATFESVDRPDIMRWKYRKLLMNLVNAVEVVCHPPGRSRISRMARLEGEACLAAAGIDVASPEEDAARRGALIEVKPVGGRMREGGSSWQSLQRSTGSIESDYLNGEVSLLGRIHGVPTPVNSLLQALAGEMAGRGAKPGELSVEEFMSRLAERQT